MPSKRLHLNRKRIYIWKDFSSEFFREEDCTIETLDDVPLGKKITPAIVGGMMMASTFTCDLPAAVAAEKYDGFAEYAKENKIEQSDVGCFINKFGD